MVLSSRSLLVLTLLAAACSTPADDGAASSGSDLTTATRVLDARTTPRFFRKHGSNASSVIDVGGGVGLFFGIHPSPEDGRDRVFLERTEGTTATTRTLLPVSGYPTDAVAFDGAMYFTTVHESSASPYDGKRLLARVDASATPLSWVEGIEGDVGAVKVSGGALWVTSTIRSDVQRISRVGTDGSVTKIWEGTATAPPRIVASASALLVQVDGRCVLVSLHPFGLLPDWTPDIADIAEVATDGTNLFARTNEGTLYRVERGRAQDYGTVPSGTFARTHGRTVIFDEKGAIYSLDEGAHWVVKLGELPFGDGWTPPVELGGELYVHARRSDELYVTDGTPLGTKDVSSGLTNVTVDEIAVQDGAIYFLGVVDGSPQSSFIPQVIRFDPRTKTRTAVTSFPGGATITHLATLGDRLVFSAGGAETELWSVKGDTAAMIEANPNGNASSGIRAFTATDSLLFYTTEEDVAPSDPKKQTALWATDGIVPVKSTALAIGSFDPTRRASVGDRLCIYESSKPAWVCSNGTAEGTARFNAPAAPIAPVTFGGAIYLASYSQLGRVDAATGQLTAVKTFNGRITNLVVQGDHLLLTVDGEGSIFDGAGLWRSDGTTATLVTADAPFAKAGVPYLGSAGAFAYFGAAKSLFTTDGTAAGTTAAPIDVGDVLATQGGALGGAFFVATTKTLWRFDGTAGTRLFSLPATGTASFPFTTSPVAFGQRLAFATSDSFIFTDGTSKGTGGYGVAGTPLLAPLPNGDLLVSTQGLYAFRSATAALDPVDPQSGASRGFFPVPSGVLFAGERTGYGDELLFSNGTGSAKVVTESFPGPGSSHPHDLVSFRNRVFYTSTDMTDDEELYVVATPH